MGKKYLCERRRKDIDIYTTGNIKIGCIFYSGPNPKKPCVFDISSKKCLVGKILEKLAKVN